MYFVLIGSNKNNYILKNVNFKLLKDRNYIFLIFDGSICKLWKFVGDKCKLHTIRGWGCN